MRKDAVKIRFFCVLMIVAGTAGAGSDARPAARAAAAAVPPAYQALYQSLELALARFDAILPERMAERLPVPVWGAELLPANANRGPELLNPGTIQGVSLYLDRLVQLGVKGVTFPIGYPLYTPGFPGYDGYVDFFKQVVAAVRARGLVLDIESGVIFANTEFSPFAYDFSALTLDHYFREKKAMVQAIIDDLHPDYLNLGAEPDTEAQLMGKPALNTPAVYAEYVRTVVDGLRKGGTRITAGIGTWGQYAQIVQMAAIPGLDGLATHVYPIYRGNFETLLMIAGLARQYGKVLVLDEAWLSKSPQPEGGGVASSVDIFKRDFFSFWEPLDRLFLETLVKFCRIYGVAYFSPFWTRFFFAYVDYGADTAGLSYPALLNLQGQTAAQAILTGQFTETGKDYRRLIQRNR